MQRTTRRWVTSAAVVSAGVLMVGPAVAAFAQTDDPSGSTTTTAPSTTEATKPLPDWFKSVLDQLVKAGTITQAQADAVTKALQDARPAMDHGGPWGGERHGGFGRIGVALDEAAKALGIDLDALRTELQSGKTLSQIATEHNIDITKVEDALTTAAKAKLDQAVKDGRITQEQADARLKQMTDRMTELVNQPFPAKGGPGHRSGHPGDKDGTTPDTSAPTTTSPGGS